MGLTAAAGISQLVTFSWLISFDAILWHFSLFYICVYFAVHLLLNIAVEILAEFARTRHLEVTPMTAVQLFIAADALDVEGARYAFNIFELGSLLVKYLL